eukprot:SAG31_NODE_40746_length_279_cov_0.816667_1_plen_64_part_10
MQAESNECELAYSVECQNLAVDLTQDAAGCDIDAWLAGRVRGRAAYVRMFHSTCTGRSTRPWPR